VAILSGYRVSAAEIYAVYAKRDTLCGGFVLFYCKTRKIQLKKYIGIGRMKKMVHMGSPMNHENPREIGGSERTVLHRLTDAADGVIKYRYIIALFVFALLVVFKINGSNLGSWERIFGQTGKSSVVAGTAKDIRSDEWEVYFPICIAQQNSKTPFSVTNPDISQYGKNVLIVMDAPVADIYDGSQPLLWGFFFLKADYAISWYWDMKLILMILLSFELCMILTKRDKMISLIGAVWIAFSPAVQWWFAQHVGTNVLYIEAIVVTFYYFLKYHDRTALQILFAFLFSLSCLGFLIPLYPPVQIPFGILAVILMALIYTDFRKTIAIRKKDLIIAGAAAVFILCMLVHLYLLVRNVIPLMSNTVYPGKRVSTGGGTPSFDFYVFLTNIWLPYENVAIPNENPCELSSFFNFLPAVLAALPVLFIWQKNRDRSLKYGIALAVFSGFFALYMAFSFVSPIVAKFTLLSYVPGSRAMLAYGFSAMLLSIWVLSALVRSGGVRRLYAVAVAAAVSVTYLLAVELTGMKANIQLRQYLVLIVVFGILNYLLLRGRKRIFCLLMICVVLAAGIPVNPINIGAGALVKSTLSQEVQAIAKSDPDAVWIADDCGDAIDDMIYANGAKSAGGISNYPSYAQWAAIDPQRKYAFVYNRSAHVSFQISQSKTAFNLLWLAGFQVSINENDLSKLKVKYIISPRNLTGMSSAAVRFKQVYPAVGEGYMVFRVVYGNSR
jgi:hypothetical protein